jgi:hypothetical protein
MEGLRNGEHGTEREIAFSLDVPSDDKALRFGDIKSRIIRSIAEKAAQADGVTLSAGSYVRASYIRASYIRASYIRASYIRASYIRARYIRATYIRASYIRASYIRASYIRARYIRAS